MKFRIDKKKSTKVDGSARFFRKSFENFQIQKNCWTFLKKTTIAAFRRYCILCMHTKFHSIGWKIDGEKFATAFAVFLRPRLRTENWQDECTFGVKLPIWGSYECIFFLYKCPNVREFFSRLTNGLEELYFSYVFKAVFRFTKIPSGTFNQIDVNIFKIQVFSYLDTGI